VGDAGELPGTAQIPTCTGALITIDGTISGDDADMYLIEIPVPAAFLATTCNLSTLDTQLFLFDLLGNGVVHNDDSANPPCGLQSTIIPNTLCPFPPGCYYIAISTFDNDPENAAGQEIWADGPFNQVRCPDGPGAPGPVAQWDGDPDVGTYTILLDNVTCCATTTAVEPATWGQIKSIY
jgi:hypothetical protein